MADLVDWHAPLDGRGTVRAEDLSALQGRIVRVSTEDAAYIGRLVEVKDGFAALTSPRPTAAPVIPMTYVPIRRVDTVIEMHDPTARA